jgi:hypothetical protein
MNNDNSIISTMDAESDDLTSMNAAMFASLGDKTELSASGHSVIFKPEYRLGRADLSGDPEAARRQLEHAGIDPGGVTEEQVQAYKQWFDQMFEAHRTSAARIVVTAKFNEPYSGGQGSCGFFNRVRLIDGWGKLVDSARVECLSEWDDAATNQLGQPGSFRALPDGPGIDAAIARLRHDHPDLAHAQVQDNRPSQDIETTPRKPSPKMGM